MKKYFVIIFFLISNYAITCDSVFYDNKNDTINAWLGNNSEFSKAYQTGKCALDVALGKLSTSQKRVIANLIAKSYNSIEIKKNNKELLTYNY